MVARNDEPQKTAAVRAVGPYEAYLADREDAVPRCLPPDVLD
jgi:hypothetical protein